MVCNLLTVDVQSYYLSNKVEKDAILLGSIEKLQVVIHDGTASVKLIETSELRPSFSSSPCGGLPSCITFSARTVVRCIDYSGIPVDLTKKGWSYGVTNFTGFCSYGTKIYMRPEKCVSLKENWSLVTELVDSGLI